MTLVKPMDRDTPARSILPSLPKNRTEMKAFAKTSQFIAVMGKAIPHNFLSSSTT